MVIGKSRHDALVDRKASIWLVVSSADSERWYAFPDMNSKIFLASKWSVVL
jgi:hypothetical protein